jgi:protein tyrosine/serine phosphatase
LDEKPVRRLVWNACYNVRDLGGYETADGRRVRWRALLRADDLCRLSAEGQQALVTYGVRTIIDLRSPSERAVAPHPFAAGAAHAPVHHALSLFDEHDVAAMAALKAAQSSGALYCAVLDFFRARVGAVLRAVVEAPEGGVLVHCFAGKDRTGIVVALALALAGVPRATIAADYALSDSYLQPLYDELLAVVDDPAERERRALRYRSPPESILAVLDHLDVRYGGVAAYLRTAGVMDEQMERIRVRLVEGDTPANAPGTRALLSE